MVSRVIQFSGNDRSRHGPPGMVPRISARACRFYLAQHRLQWLGDPAVENEAYRQQRALACLRRADDRQPLDGA